jgi:hypothetical protein
MVSFVTRAQLSQGKAFLGRGSNHVRGHSAAPNLFAGGY